MPTWENILALFFGFALGTLLVCIYMLIYNRWFNYRDLKLPSGIIKIKSMKEYNYALSLDWTDISNDVSTLCNILGVKMETEL